MSLSNIKLINCPQEFYTKLLGAVIFFTRIANRQHKINIMALYP